MHRGFSITESVKFNTGETGHFLQDLSNWVVIQAIQNQWKQDPPKVSQFHLQFFCLNVAILICKDHSFLDDRNQDKRKLSVLICLNVSDVLTFIGISCVFEFSLPLEEKSCVLHVYFPICVGRQDGDTRSFIYFFFGVFAYFLSFVLTSRHIGQFWRQHHNHTRACIDHVVVRCHKQHNWSWPNCIVEIHRYQVMTTSNYHTPLRRPNQDANNSCFRIIRSSTGGSRLIFWIQGQIEKMELCTHLLVLNLMLHLELAFFNRRIFGWFCVSFLN